MWKKQTSPPRSFVIIKLHRRLIKFFLGILSRLRLLDVLSEVLTCYNTSELVRRCQNKSQVVFDKILTGRSGLVESAITGVLLISRSHRLFSCQKLWLKIWRQILTSFVRQRLVQPVLWATENDEFLFGSEVLIRSHVKIQFLKDILSFHRRLH